MLDVGKMVDAVLEVIDRPLRALSERIKAVEARQPERGQPGEKGDKGDAGKDGFIGPRGEAGPQGPQGEKGIDGQDGLPGLHGEKGDPGRDGRDAGDLTLLKSHIAGMVAGCFAEVFKQVTFSSPDGGRTLQFTFAGTPHEIKTAIPLDRGVWRAGAYKSGDAVSFGGSIFIAQQDTDTKPETEDSHWRLSVKRGRDGRDGKPGDRGPQGPRGDTIEQRRMSS